jgi:hypothetical protein
VAVPVAVPMAIALLACTTVAANADFIFTPGNNPQVNEENILFGPSQITNVPVIVGTTNQSGTPITFDIVPGGLGAESELSDNGVGQADITCVLPGGGCGTDGAGGANGHQLTDLEIKMPSLIGAQDFIGNLDFGEGTFDIKVTDQFSNTFFYTLGNGQNFFTITTINDEVIKDIQITADASDAGAPFGFNDFKQPRVSGLCQLSSPSATSCVPLVAVPEPGTLSLVGFALMLLGWLGLRKKFSGVGFARFSHLA